MSEQLVLEIIPEFVKIKIGNSIFDLAYDSLIASMTHQYLSNHHTMREDADYDLIFEVTKELISDFVKDNIDKKEYIDILGDWVPEFVVYHNEKNKPLCKDINITFKNGSIWQIKLLDLLAHKYDVNNDSESDEDDFEIDYNDSLLKDDNEIIQYLENLSWNDIQEIAEEIQQPQPEPNYNELYETSEKTVISWEKNISLLDFFDISDIINISEDQEEDEEDD
jgi:hypothetical protein